MKKKALYAILSFALLFSFVGCKKKNNDTTTKKTNDKTTLTRSNTTSSKPNTTSKKTTQSITTTSKKDDTFKVTFNTNGGSNIDSVDVAKGAKVTKPNDPTRDGYTFSGWFKDQGLNTEFDFSEEVINSITTIYAKWTANADTAYIVEHYLQNLNDDNYATTPFKTDNLTGTTDTLTMAEAKTFDGYTSPEVTQAKIKGDGSTVIKLYYARNTYTVSLTSDITNAGTLSGAGSYKFGRSVTITAEPNLGYVFIGWYLGSTELSTSPSCSFTMSANDMEITAKWAMLTAYKVEHYLQNVDNDSYPNTPYETDNLSGLKNTLTSAEANTYNGFTSPSVTQENIKENGSTVIKLYYTRNSYELSLTKSIDMSQITLTGAGSYKYEKTVTVSTTIDESMAAGYTFNGWYLNNELVNEDASFNYTITDNATLEARYTRNQYTVTIVNNSEDVTISGVTSGTQYGYLEYLTLTASNIPTGYVVKWSRNDGVIQFGEEYSFNVVGNLTITVDSYSVPYTRDNLKITFGTYPQMKVEATSANGLTAYNTFNLNTWTSYNYYNASASTKTDFMYYRDVDTNGDGAYDYRGVYISSYRAKYVGGSQNQNDSFQYANGYSTGTIYWFKYEPIEWTILEIDGDKALIFANLILDSNEFYQKQSSGEYSHNGGTGYGNNYELSNIRQFLINDFYNMAFNTLEKQIIRDTLVDNSASSTFTEPNPYACNNTNDKIFLLSYEEANNYFKKDTQRTARPTDYAKCQGLECHKDASNYDWGGYLLRSPHWNTNSDYSYVKSNVVEYDGSIAYGAIYYTDYGVRPACWINL